MPTGRSLPSGESRLNTAGDNSRSSARRRAAVLRKSGLAKFDNLPGEAAVRARGIRVARVRRYRAAHQWCLAETHGLLDHVFEDVVIAKVAQLREHVAS